MSLSITARYIHIAALYTFHAGRATRRVWDNHNMTPRTMQTALNTANAIIHLCVFIWWLLSKSDWSMDAEHIQISRMQAITAPDLTPTIEDIEEQLNEVYAQISDDLNQQFDSYPAPILKAIETPLDSELSAASLPSLSWTKADLVQACRSYGLKPTGAKTLLVERLLHQLT